MDTSSITRQAADYLAQSIRHYLAQDQSVLWLLSGGSAIAVAIAVLNQLPNSHYEKLNVGLVDERYGEPGHIDSNETQLMQAGFDTGKVQFHPVLQHKPIDITAREYSDIIRNLLSASDVCIALLGIGNDGHTAGLLPNSSALTSTKLYAHYLGPDFNRITATPQLFPHIDEAVVYACGNAKWPALQQMDQNGPTHTVPSRLIKQAHKVIRYTDYHNKES